MSGSIKVGGNTIATHTGAQGAGQVTLGTNIRLPASGGIQDSSGNNVLTESGGNTTISNSAIKLKSSGNSITKSDGTTAVLSESGGVVTLGTVTLGGTVTNDTNVIGFRKRLPADVTSSGIMTYSATGAYINGMTESAGTITIQKAGRYFAYVSLYVSHSSASLDYIVANVRVNTTNELSSNAHNFGSTVAKRESISIGGLINLAVDDTVDVYLDIIGSGTVFNGIGSELHLFYVGQ